MTKKEQDRLFLLIAGGACLFAAVAVGWLISGLSTDVLRLWTGVSVFLLPVVFFGGWQLGTRDARAHLSGLDKGIAAASTAIKATGKARAQVGRKAEVAAGLPALPRLPEPEIVHARTAGAGEVIDL